MRVGNFEVFVTWNGMRKNGNDGYVALPHNTTYTITLANNSGLRANAKCLVDGKSIGDFRVGPGFITLERPSNEAKLFTFYALGTKEAEQVQLDQVSNDDLGLIQITFVPEKPKPTRGINTVSGAFVSGNINTRGGDFVVGNKYISKSNTRSASLGAGGTGLSGHSSQRFVQAEEIEEDWSKAVVIYLRLVELKEEPTPLIPSPRSNTYPPPVS